MRDLRVSGSDLEALAVEVLGSGNALRFQARGASMWPAVRDGDVIEVRPLDAAAIRRGDVILCCNGHGRVLVHRVIKANRVNGLVALVTRGDALTHADGPLSQEQVLGRVVALERSSKRIELDRGSQRMAGILWIRLLALNAWLYSALVAFRRRMPPTARELKPGFFLDRLADGLSKRASNSGERSPNCPGD